MTHVTEFCIFFSKKLKAVLLFSFKVYHAFYQPLEFTVPERDSSRCYIKVCIFSSPACSLEWFPVQLSASGCLLSALGKSDGTSLHRAFRWRNDARICGCLQVTAFFEFSPGWDVFGFFRARGTASLSRSSIERYIFFPPIDRDVAIYDLARNSLERSGFNS